MTGQTSDITPAAAPDETTLATHRFKICMIGYARGLHLRRWVELFRQRGHEVIVLTSGDAIELSVPVHSIEPRRPLPFLRTFQRMRRARRLVAQLRPDIVLGQYLVGAGWCAAHCACGLRGAIAWGSDISPLLKRMRYEEYRNHQAVGRLDFLVALSGFMHDAYLAYGAAPEKVHRLNYPRQWLPAPETLEGEFAEAFGGSGLISEKYILSLRGMKQVYNQETIIRAIPRVLERHPGLRFVFLRFGSDPDYIARLERMVRDKGLEQAVLFLDAQPPERFALLCRHALVGVSVSSSDGMPLSVLEAMSLGVPVIAGRIPPIEEIVTVGQSGLLVDCQSPDELAEGLIGLAGDADQRQALARGGRQALDDFFKPENELGELEQALHEMIRRKG